MIFIHFFPVIKKENEDKVEKRRYSLLTERKLDFFNLTNLTSIKNYTF